MNPNAIVPHVPPTDIAALDDIGAQCALTKLESDGNFQRTFLVAAAVQTLRKCITPTMMRDIMALQGTRLGFLTDKDKSGGYPVEDVKECLIEATLRGLRAVGNEWNIITGKTYITKEGMSRLVGAYPGLTDLELTLGVPVNKGGGAVVDCAATWRLDGTEQSLERSIPVKVNAGMGVDAILGKATRKLLASVYGRITGSAHGIPEGDVLDVESEPVSRTEALEPEAAALVLPPAETKPASKPVDPDPEEEAAEQAQAVEEYGGEIDRAAEGPKPIEAIHACVNQAHADENVLGPAGETIAAYGEKVLAKIRGKRGQQSNQTQQELLPG